MINGRQSKQDARQDNQQPEQSLVTRAIGKFMRDVQEASGQSDFFGNLQLTIGFKGGVPENAGFDRHEWMK